MALSNTVMILNGASISGSLNLGDPALDAGYTPSRILLPDAWTAASITFQVSADGTNFRDLYDENGNEIIYPAAANRAVIVNEPDMKRHNYLKIRSGTSSTPVNQGADRIITVVKIPG